MKQNIASNQHGLSLIEIIVVIFLLTVLALGVYGLFGASLKIIDENKCRVGALAIANEQMELIRNLPYNDVGVIGGIPPGSMPAEQTTISNGVTYHINILIIYVDDPFDGTAGGIGDDKDLLPTDYKKARVQVRWESRFNPRPIILISDIAPKGIESIAGGGTLYIKVFDASGLGIGQANVHIENNDVEPPINMDIQTNDNGIVLLPGAPESQESYNIVVTKANHSTDQTHEPSAENPYPIKLPASVYEGEVTEISFAIDMVSTLHINTEDYITHESIANLGFNLRGFKLIGHDEDMDPVYKYSEDLTTDINGSLALNNMEWDSYNFTIMDISYDLAGSNPAEPLNLMPNNAINATLWLAPHANNTLLVTVRDDEGSPIVGATIQLTCPSLSYNESQNTGISGQTFFTPLVADNYNLNISKSGYDAYSDTIEILDQTTVDVTLSSS